MIKPGYDKSKFILHIIVGLILFNSVVDSHTSIRPENMFYCEGARDRKMSALIGSMLRKKTVFALLCLLVISVATVGLPQKIFGITTIKNSNCETISIKKVMTNGFHQNNKAENAINNRLDTIRSALGAKPYIQTDLGLQKSLCDIKVAWLNGDKHLYRFTISASVDGIKFLQILKGKSKRQNSNPRKI